MAYTATNYRTKRALREAVAAGATVRVFHPGRGPVADGLEFIEGPHYPEPHRWYAQVIVRDSVILKVKS